jgi:hypothetical protein
MKYEEKTFEGKAAHEVEYKENGKEYEAIYGADGLVTERRGNRSRIATRARR